MNSEFQQNLLVETGPWWLWCLQSAWLTCVCLFVCLQPACEENNTVSSSAWHKKKLTCPGCRSSSLSSGIFGTFFQTSETENANKKHVSPARAVSRSSARPSASSRAPLRGFSPHLSVFRLLSNLFSFSLRKFAAGTETCRVAHVTAAAGAARWRHARARGTGFSCLLFYFKILIIIKCFKIR